MQYFKNLTPQKINIFTEFLVFFIIIILFIFKPTSFEEKGFLVSCESFIVSMFSAYQQDF